MTKNALGASDDSTVLGAKFYELKDRAAKIVEQAKKLASEPSADKNIAAQAKSIAAEARLLADEARSAKKVES